MCDRVTNLKKRQERHRRKATTHLADHCSGAVLAQLIVISSLLGAAPIAGLPAASLGSSVMTKLLTRRNVGLGALGLAAAAGINYSQQQRLRSISTRAELPGFSPFAGGTSTSSSSTTPSSASSMSKPAGPVTPMRAVNLRDIGEVDPRLRKGILYRCSQIYTPDVLRDLKIRTVVDLRGRADKKHKKNHKGSKGTGPPPLMPHEQIDTLAKAGPSGSPSAAGAARALSAQQQGGGPVTTPLESAGSVDEDITITTLKRQGSMASIDASGSESESENGSGTVRKARGEDEMAAGLTEGEFDLAAPDVENFNVIPTKEFGLAMLRMPWRVWRSALLNLATGKDAKRPFVDAFADEQLLGFTKYYTIILEHSKKNIAAVMRLFAKEKNFPALVHCAHGKDRTGVIIMLLLMACDVPHEAIVQDYVQSEVELRRYRESLGLPDPTGATGAVIPLSEVIIASTQETLRAVLAYMDQTYITVDNYLASCGLTQAEIQAIKNNLLKPGAPAQAPAGSQQEPLSPAAAKAAAEAAIGAGGATSKASSGRRDEF